MLYRVGVCAVVSPVALARERCDGHELYGIDACGCQVVEAGDDRLECSFVCKCANMDFVKDGFSERNAFPPVILPLISCVIYDFGWAVYAFRLIMAGRI